MRISILWWMARIHPLMTGTLASFVIPMPMFRQVHAKGHQVELVPRDPVSRHLRLLPLLSLPLRKLTAMGNRNHRHRL